MFLSIKKDDDSLLCNGITKVLGNLDLLKSLLNFFLSNFLFSLLFSLYTLLIFALLILVLIIFIFVYLELLLFKLSFEEFKVDFLDVPSILFLFTLFKLFNNDVSSKIVFFKILVDNCKKSSH